MALLLRFSAAKKLQGILNGSDNSDLSLDVSMVDTNSLDSAVDEATSCSGGREKHPSLNKIVKALTRRKTTAMTKLA